MPPWIAERQLFERYGVPYYWIVDPDARAIDISRAASGRYGAPSRLGDDELVDLPPFSGLSIDPIALWR